MTSQPALIGTTLMAVAALGLANAIAAEAASRAPQPSGICSQIGSGYLQVYVIEEEARSITICQKDNQYYYISKAK